MILVKHGNVQRNVVTGSRNVAAISGSGRQYTRSRDQSTSRRLENLFHKTKLAVLERCLKISLTRNVQNYVKQLLRQEQKGE